MLIIAPSESKLSFFNLNDTASYYWHGSSVQHYLYLDRPTIYITTIQYDHALAVAETDNLLLVVSCERD